MDGFTRGDDRDVMALVEAERRRLGKADAIPASLSVALDHADNTEADGTQFSLVVEAVRELIVTSMECLDSTKLKPTRTSMSTAHVTE